METSDRLIDYKAYAGFLRKVTEDPVDSRVLRDAILSKTDENTEMQIAWIILKRLLLAASILLVCASGVAGFGYVLYGHEDKGESDLWNLSRTDDKAADGAMRLYEAYEHSMKVREKNF